MVYAYYAYKIFYIISKRKINPKDRTTSEKTDTDTHTKSTELKTQLYKMTDLRNNLWLPMVCLRNNMRFNMKCMGKIESVPILIALLCIYCFYQG
jgi:hypothetical protein